nr:hypothetical protein [Tepidiforma sp.]
MPKKAPATAASSCGIGEDDVGGLAAEFEAHLFDVIGGGAHDGLAAGGGAGESDLIDEFGGCDVLADECAVVGFAGDDVEDAVGEAGFGEESGEHEGGAGGVVGWLGHHGAAGGDGGPDLPGDEKEREVPGGDDTDDADRLMGDDADGIGDLLGEGFAFEVEGLGGEELEDIDGGHDFAEGHGLRLADFGGDAGREGIGALGEEIGGPAEDAGAVGGGGGGPGGFVEGAACGEDGALGIFDAAVGVDADDGAVVGAGAGEGRAADGIEPFAIDELLVGCDAGAFGDGRHGRGSGAMCCGEHIGRSGGMPARGYATMMAANGSSARTAARTMVLVPIGPDVFPKQPHEGLTLRLRITAWPAASSRNSRASSTAAPIGRPTNARPSAANPTATSQAGIPLTRRPMPLPRTRPQETTAEANSCR